MTGRDAAAAGHPRTVDFVSAATRLSAWPQRHFLDAPVAKLADEQFIVAAAVDGVDDVEFLRQTTGAAELADDPAVKFELVDLTVVQRFRIVRVRRVEVLMR